MSKGKRLRQRTAAAEMTECKLAEGWAGAPRVRVWQAMPADLPAIAELAPLGQVRLEDALTEAFRGGFSGAALRAGIQAG